MRKLTLFLLLLAAAGTVSANTLGNVATAVTDLCCSLQGLLPVVAMLMVIFAGVIYASGQIMGAETRARANVWATAALTGALMAILIFAIAPPVLDSLMPGVNGACFCP
jgi:hypothetical protein